MSACPLHLLAVATAFAGSAFAQCALQPVPSGGGVPSLDGQAYACARWDPDGNGPLGERLIVGGAFSLAGDVVTAGVAAFDPALLQWTSLGVPGGNPVAFAELPNGTLLAAGSFSTTPSMVDTLIQWNGTQWASFAPAPMPGLARALAAAPNGDVYLAVATAGTAGVQRFAGGAWQTIGNATHPFASPEVRAFAVAPNGDVIAGGRFDTIGGVAAAGIARWNGTTWAPLGAGIDGRVHSLAFAANGDLLAGGLFATAGGVAANNVARWNGASWAPLGSGTSSIFPPAAVVHALAVEGNGDVIAGGEFSAAGGVPANCVARWDGAAWSSMGAGIETTPFGGEGPAVRTLAAVAGGVFAGGNFGRAGGRDALGLAQWNGSAWGPVTFDGIGGVVTSVHLRGSELYIGGGFRDVDGVVCNGVARRVGNGWQPLGAGIAPFASFGSVRAIDTDANGDLVVGGYFAAAGAASASGIARWDGSVWSSLGAGLTLSSPYLPEVLSMHRASNGDLWVAGTFDAAGGLAAESVARWNGASWSVLPPGLSQPGFPTYLGAVAAMPNGDVVVAGHFALGGAGQIKVARWNGSSWQLLGIVDNIVSTLLPLPNGDLLVGGSYSQIFGVASIAGLARWSNGAWSAVGSVSAPVPGSVVDHLSLLPGGDVVAAGWLSVNGQTVGLARWDGTNWSALAGAPLQVFDVAVDPRGELLLGGAFTSIAGVASAYFGRFATPCPAAVVASGANCSGSGGPNVLATSSLPWLGNTFESTATGMPANGLALAVFGFGAAAVPLAAILPQGAPGCTLLAAPDVVSAFVTNGSALAVSLPLPLTPPLVGAVLHEQVVPFDLGSGGAITSVTATNRLTLVLGLF